MIAAYIYTKPQITIHWVIVGLVVAQFLTADAMETFFDAAEKSNVLAGFPTNPTAIAHAVGGSIIVLLMLLRLGLRLTFGAPPAPASLAPVAQARLTYYPLLVLYPSHSTPRDRCCRAVSQPGGRRHTRRPQVRPYRFRAGTRCRRSGACLRPEGWCHPPDDPLVGSHCGWRGAVSRSLLMLLAARGMRTARDVARRRAQSCCFRETMKPARSRISVRDRCRSGMGACGEISHVERASCD